MPMRSGSSRPATITATSARQCVVYWDAVTGRPVAAQVPGRGSAGDLFMQAQFPLHSGRIAGVAGVPR